MPISTLLFSSPKWILSLALFNKSFGPSKSSSRSKAGQQRFRLHGLIYCWLVLRNKQFSVVFLAGSKCWGNVSVPLSCWCWLAALTALILGWDRRSSLENSPCHPPVPSRLGHLRSDCMTSDLGDSCCLITVPLLSGQESKRGHQVTALLPLLLCVSGHHWISVCSILPLFSSDVIIVRGLLLQLIRVTGDSST